MQEHIETLKIICSCSEWEIKEVMSYLKNENLLSDDGRSLEEYVKESLSL